MSLVTKVEPTKRGDRFSIFLEREFAFSVCSYILKKYKISNGSNLSVKQVERILLEENGEFLKERALDYLSFRPRSEREVVNKIKNILSGRLSKFTHVGGLNISKIYSQILDYTLVFLKEYGYLNDKSFTEWLIDQRVSQGKGPMFIRQDLLQKGVDRALTEECLRSVDFLIALKKEHAKALKKFSKEKNRYKKKNRIIRYLTSRGFEYEKILSLDQDY